MFEYLLEENKLLELLEALEHTQDKFSEIPDTEVAKQLKDSCVLLKQKMGLTQQQNDQDNDFQAALLNWANTFDGREASSSIPSYAWFGLIE